MGVCVCGGGVDGWWRDRGRQVKRETETERQRETDKM